MNKKKENTIKRSFKINNLYYLLNESIFSIKERRGASFNACPFFCLFGKAFNETDPALVKTPFTP